MVSSIYDKEIIKLDKIDEEAFIDIYNKFWQKLFVIAYNRLNSRPAAEDIVQDVMICLWKRKDQLEINNLESWLAMATKYSVLRQLAKYGPRRISRIDSDADTACIEELDFRHYDKMIKEGVKELPPKCKIVFEYSRNHGLTNKQIAGKLSISVKTVEKHITKAIHKIRQKIS